MKPPNLSEPILKLFPTMPKRSLFPSLSSSKRRKLPLSPAIIAYFFKPMIPMLHRSHSVKRNKNLSVSTRLKLFLKHFLLLKGKLFLSSKKPWSLIASHSSPFCKARPIYLSLAKKSRIHGIPKTFLESPVSFMNVSINGHLSHSTITF